MFGPGDGIAILGMVLALLLTLSIGGFILLLPITKRLGGALDQWIRIKRSEGASEDEIARFRADMEGFRLLLDSVDDRLERVEEQQQFVEAFLVSRGNIKEVERELAISYPTVRKKLDEIAQALGHAPVARRREQEEILDAIDRGGMSPKDGIAAMKALNSRD